MKIFVKVDCEENIQEIKDECGTLIPIDILEEWERIEIRENVGGVAPLRLGNSREKFYEIEVFTEYGE
mgnify:CR=1 FL=1